MSLEGSMDDNSLSNASPPMGGSSKEAAARLLLLLPPLAFPPPRGGLPPPPIPPVDLEEKEEWGRRRRGREDDEEEGRWEVAAAILRDCVCWGRVGGFQEGLSVMNWWREGIAKDMERGQQTIQGLHLCVSA